MTLVAVFRGTVLPILWGDGEHDDSTIIRTLLNGGSAYDRRICDTVTAPNFGALPPGLYRMSR